VTASSKKNPAEVEKRAYCTLKPATRPELPPGLGLERSRAILVGANKWVNGTVLHYYFFDKKTDGQKVKFSDGSTKFVSWVGAEEQRQVVRDSFQVWKDLGIGLEFKEVEDRAEAEVRVGFMETDGSWSYIGRDVLGIGTASRTMNFGWDLTDDYGHTTALHEIGHTLGMPHEHQNPFAGIVWDEPKVYAYFAGEPNNWDHDTTLGNVLKKLSTNEVQGSSWDPDSIMEYWFPKGLIKTPAKYHDNGISPPGTISPVDAKYILTWYPALGAAKPKTLKPLVSQPLDLGPGEQANFTIKAPGTRKYQLGTFGDSDVVIALFEDVDGELRFVAGDDDSGEDRNAHLEVKLFKSKRYVLRIRLYSSFATGQTAVMYW
jgi:hypothetical protein